jgi:hypothetical protein
VSQFDLDEAAVAQTEQLLLDTGEAVNTQAGIARDAIGGADWQGGASVTANGKQNDEFAGAVSKLHTEINRISEGLGLGRMTTVNQDQDSSDAYNTIPVDLGNFGRI